MHPAKCFPAHVKGYGEGRGKLLCLEDVVVGMAR